MMLSNLVGATAIYNSFFGKPDGIFYITNVRCSGSESRLVDCSHSALALSACGDGEYAGVKCLGDEQVFFGFAELILCTLDTKQLHVKREVFELGAQEVLTEDVLRCV